MVMHSVRGRDFSFVRISGTVLGKALLWETERKEGPSKPAARPVAVRGDSGISILKGLAVFPRLPASSLTR